MKKIVCGCFGTIYYAQILKNGLMSSTNREDVTDDAIYAVLEHLIASADYKTKGFFGYTIESKSDNTPINLLAYDTTKYTLVRKEEWKSQ